LVFSEAHTGENIKAATCETTEMFGLKDKHTVYVTDQSLNVVKACRWAGVERYGCVAHGLHILIMVYGIGKCQKAYRMLDKVKGIIKMFT